MKKGLIHSIRRVLSIALIFALILTGFPGALSVSAQKGSSDSIGVLNDDISGVYDRSTYRNGNKNSRLFNDGWKFAMFEDNAGGASFNDAAWQDVELPHDWMIHDEEARSLFRRAHEYFGWGKTAWYRNTFYLPSGDEGKNISLRFDGIYMDTEIYVNGERISGISPQGYLPIQIDVSDKVKFGNTPNVIAIKINFGGPSSRFYSGSGIYRNAWLTVTDPVHVNPDGTYISTNGSDEVKIQTEVVNKSASAANVTVVHNIIDAEDKVVQTIEGTSQNIVSQEIVKDTQTTTLSSPRLWDIDDPYVYRVETQIKSNGTVVDEYLSVFGFKTIEMDPDEGFYLNGRHIKLEGACMHHDLGALGAAVNYRALERQMEIMKDMGINAIRLSHNPATPELLEICDRMGLLVVNELHDTWNQGKIPNDHSRFFGKWHEQDTKTWVRRDRNHPSMIMWGIGNEIQETGFDQNTVKIAENLVRYIREEDPDKNAFTTIGTDLLRTSSSNPVDPNKPAQKISGGIVEATGYNYNRGESFDSQHEAYPDMPIYGSETSSSTQSRGIYHFPPEINSTSSPDRQCSSYGNSVMLHYAHGIEDAWKWDRDRKFVLGSFIWTGFDYLGEPTPFGGNNTSFFGAVDTAGIPKDAFYFYKSVWGDEPVLHLFPYWDWNEGDTIPVWAYTNADSVELFKDGVSLGRQDFDLMGDVLHLEWDVVFHEGTNLKAVAYDEDGNVIATDQLSSFGDPVKVNMEPDRTTITADGRDLVFVETSVLDAKGVAVENARNIVEFKVSGAGKLVGVDNGDSVDFDSYEGPERKLFSGKAMAIIQSDGTGGEINITATSPGLESDTVTVSAVHKQKVSGIEVEGIDGISAIDENRGKLKINTSVSPANADYQKMNFEVTEEDGVTATDKAVIDKNGVLTAYKNGKVLVTASAADGSGASASMTVTITNQSAFTPVASLTVSGEDITTKSGTSQMSASINPNGAAVTDVKWTVENKSGSGAACASIDNGGLLKAHYDGEVTVRAAALDGSGVYGEQDIAISGQTTTSVPARKISLELTEGSDVLSEKASTAKIRANVFPAEAAAADLEWSVVGADGNPTSLGSVVLKPGSPNEALVLLNRSGGTFKVQASTKNGTDHLQVIGSMTFTTKSDVPDKDGKDPYIQQPAVENDGTNPNASMTPEAGGLGGINPGDWIAFKDLNFGETAPKKISLTGCNGADDGTAAIIEIRKGAPDGDLVTTLEFPSAGSWTSGVTNTFDLSAQPALKGTQDLYFVFKNGYFLFINFNFAEEQTGRNLYKNTLAKTYDDSSKAFPIENGDALGDIGNGDWVGFKKFDFGDIGADQIVLTCSKLSGNAPIEIRGGSPTGDVIATLNFPSTGGWNTFVPYAFDIPKITGEQDIYFVFPEGGYYFKSLQFIRHYVKSPVTNSGHAAAVPFNADGGTIDLSKVGGLFTIDDHAGAPAYSIESSGNPTGAGVIGADKKTLKVTATGTFTIGLTTAETSTHTAGGKVMATLTVNPSAAVQSAVNKINAIGEVTLDKKAAVEDARRAYDKLTPSEKELIKNIDVLLKAEAKIKELSSKPITPDKPVRTPLKKGAKFTAGQFKYQVKKAATLRAQGSVEILRPVRKTFAKITIRPTVKYQTFTYKVISIGKSAFKNNKKLKSAVIGSNVESILNDAFAGCIKLKKVTIGKNVKKIGKNAFRNSKTLKTICFKTKRLKLSAVGKGAFKNIHKKAVIKAPTAKLRKQYKKFLKK